MVKFWLEVDANGWEVVHLRGIMGGPTFCSDVWASYVPHEGPVTCPGCIKAIREASELLRGVRMDDSGEG